MKKLQNEKTGDIGVLNVSNNKYYVIAYGMPLCGNSVLGEYDNLGALMQEWEDYEEPKNLYVIDSRRSSCIGIITREDDADWYDNMVELGLGFETEEEAEKAVEKLKAWTRLRKKGFKFTDYKLYRGPKITDREFAISAESPVYVDHKDLDLLFGGEE